MKLKIKGFLSRFRPLLFSRALAYMLQSVEYQPQAFIDWYGRTKDFSSVMHRRSLHSTKFARMFQFGALGVQLAMYVVALYFGLIWPVGTVFGLLIIAASPIVVFVSLVSALLISRKLVYVPREKKALAEAQRILKNHEAIVIAVAGSYGKTSMKELLLTVLSEGKRVAATPANMNVAASHAKFARGLKGNEEVVIIEFGEGKPGDVKRFTEMAQPDIAIITGLAPAHLDQYQSFDVAIADILSVTEGRVTGNVYMNTESSKLHSLYKQGYKAYNNAGCGFVVLSDIQMSVQGTDFSIKIGDEKPQKAHTALLGKHNLGPLAAAAEIARSLGLTTDQIVAGISKTKPFEHRMEPRRLAGGAWLIDDTYNGNIEGIRAGLALLKALPAQHKWYVTPGLVDQGEETVAVHRELGRLIAEASPDTVVLMKNSATHYIIDGLREAMFTGDVRQEVDPLRFYTNIDSFLAAGDIALLQNDWTDNYA